jgi:hypothetical protein
LRGEREGKRGEKDIEIKVIRVTKGIKGNIFGENMIFNEGNEIGLCEIYNLDFFI